MKKQFVLTGFGLSVIVVGVLIVGLAAGFAAQQGGQRGPATPPAPCGPNMAGALSVNTAKDSRCFELRMYTIDPTRDGVGNFKGGINELHKRFREGEVEVFRKNGVDVMAAWQSLDDPNTLIYLLSYKDRAAREAGWAGFGADPKWTELRTKYFVPITTKVFMMSATDYSPLK